MHHRHYPVSANIFFSFFKTVNDKETGYMFLYKITWLVNESSETRTQSPGHHAPKGHITILIITLL